MYLSEQPQIKYPFSKQTLKKTEIFGKIKDVELTQFEKFNCIVNADSIKIDNRVFKFTDDLRITVTDKNKKKLNDFYESLQIGQRASFVCDLRKPRNKRNPGEFDYYSYLLQNKIVALGYVKSVEGIKTDNDEMVLTNIIHFIRKYIDGKLRLINDKKTYSLLRGLILADRNLIEYDDKQNFINSGVIHVLAVSGLHVGYIAIIFYALFSRFHILSRSILTILGLLTFMLITGVPPSVFRATVMGIMLILARVSGRGNSIYNNLAIAALIILIINPQELFNPGFQLSFSAVLAIVSLAPVVNQIFIVKKIPKIIKGIATLFIVSFVAQIGTLPFTLYYFGKLSLVALFANLVVIPLIGVIIGIAITGLFLSFISVSTAIYYSITNNILSDFLFFLTEKTGQFDYSFISIKNFSLIDSLLFYFVLILFFFTLMNYKRKLALVLVTVLLFLIYANLSSFANFKLLGENELIICAIDVGQGDAILIKFPNGKTALIDAGNATPYFDNGQRVIAPLLDNLEIKEIDYMFVTHLDSDHYKGLPYLVKENRVKFVYKPPLDSTLNKDIRFEKFLDDHKVKIMHYKKEFLDIGNCRLYFLADTKTALYKSFDVNNKSGIVKLIHGNNSFLFVGDAEHEMESYLARCYKDFLQCDYLKVSHHGSKTGSIPQFLEYVSPKIAVISAGIDNKFNHPSPEVISRLEQYDCEINRTDKEGAVIYKSDGNKIEKIYWR